MTLQSFSREVDVGALKADMDRCGGYNGQQRAEWRTIISPTLKELVLQSKLVLKFGVSGKYRDAIRFLLRVVLGLELNRTKKLNFRTPSSYKWVPVLSAFVQY